MHGVFVALFIRHSALQVGWLIGRRAGCLGAGSLSMAQIGQRLDYWMDDEHSRQLSSQSFTVRG